MIFHGGNFQFVNRTFRISKQRVVASAANAISVDAAFFLIINFKMAGLNSKYRVNTSNKFMICLWFYAGGLF